MELPVRLSPNLARQTGSARLTASLPDSATISDLVQQLCMDYPALESQLQAAIVVIAGQPAGPDQALQPGQEVAILSPISGGRK